MKEDPLVLVILATLALVGLIVYVTCRLAELHQ
jgi:hypothetical protein